MKYNYKFNNLLGTVYRKGNILFTQDGNCVVSPVGNRITIYNLKQNKSNTLPVQSHFNYTAIDVSPNGSILLAINEKGEAQMISLLTCTVIHRYKFKQQVNAVKFSPDGKYFAACCDDTVFIMTAPSNFTGEYRSFVMKRVFKKSNDEVTCLDWSTCSKLLAVGSKDTTTKIYTVDYLDNISMYSLSGHTDKIVGVFFEKKSLDLVTVSRNGQVCLWEANLDSDDLVTSAVQISRRKRRKIQQDESDDDVDEKNVIEKDKDAGLTVACPVFALDLDAKWTPDESETIVGNPDKIARRSRAKAALVKRVRSVAVFSLGLRKAREAAAAAGDKPATPHTPDKAAMALPAPMLGGELSLIPIEQLIQVDDVKPRP